MTDGENQVSRMGNNDFSGIEKSQRVRKAKNNGLGGRLQTAEVAGRVSFLIERIRSARLYLSRDGAERFGRIGRTDQTKLSVSYGSLQTIMASQAIRDRTHNKKEQKTYDLVFIIHFFWTGNIVASRIITKGALKSRSIGLFL